MSDMIVGVQLTILGMGMVLIILTLLYGAVATLGWMVNREAGESAPVTQTRSEAPTAASPEQGPQGRIVVRDQGEHVAAISAAVAAYKRVQRTRSHKSPYMVPYN